MKKLIAAVALVATGAQAAEEGRFAGVEIERRQVADNLYMLKGAGGNIAVFAGGDGVFMVDDQFAPLTEKIRRAIAPISDEPLRFVINTHWHGDHTGGNENFGGAGALIVAHKNVRERMSTEQFIEAFQRKVPASPETALPAITFTDATTFHWNGDTVRVQHVQPAHTDGDAIVHFVGANVIHTGDTYFNGNYPFIDLSSGGSVDGVIAAMDRVLDLADEKTRIIPGHGPLSNRAELKQQRDILVELRNRIRNLIDAGKSREQVIAARPTQKYDKKYGQGFMKPDIWTGIVYDSLAAERH